MDQKLWFLKKCSLFERLNAKETHQLEAQCLMRAYPRGSIIYSPTELGQSVMVLASGRVKIKDLTPAGKETILTFIEEGELFGELALIEEESREEYAEAVVDSTVLAVPRESMLDLMSRRSDLALSITKLIGARRKRIENRLRNLLFVSSYDRLLHILAELVADYGQWHKNGQCEIRLALSHQDLASLIGVARETVTATLGQLQAIGLIRMQRRRIIILDYKRLLAESISSSNGEMVKTQP